MRVVLAYSGGLDTSVLLSLLKEAGSEVITVTVDVGQEDDFKEIADKAEKLGAAEHYYIDAKEEFAQDYVFPAIKANAMYQGKYPLSSAIARPLIASKLVKVAEKEGADAVVHGCSGKGNDQIRFDVTIKALNPSLKVFAPVRDWGLARDWEYEYAKSKGIPVKYKSYSVDENLWGRSIEGGVLEDPSREPPEDAFKWTVSPEKAPNEPEYLTIDFMKGVPFAVNGDALPPSQLIATLNIIAGRHGIGRIDHIEDRTVGLKSREVYECPAATVIIEAHKDLEKMVLTKRELSFKLLVDETWSDLVYTGLWVEPLKSSLDAFINNMEEKVNGSVTLKLYKGSARVVGRSSYNSLYEDKLVAYESHSTLSQEFSKGFVELWGLQSIIGFRTRRGIGVPLQESIAW
ncbi:MAG: argininosuccinate synthase [Candidatus Methanodesulfokora washburnensis]